MKASCRKPKLLLLASLFFLFSCTSTDAPFPSEKGKDSSEKGSSGTDKVYKLQYNPPNGSQLVYNFTNQLSLKQEVRGTEVRTDNRTEVEMLHAVTKDSLGNSHLKATYRKFRTKLRMGDHETVLDAHTAASAFSPQEKVFAAFNGASFYVSMSKEGNVQKVDGLEKISSRMYELASGDAQAIQVINGTASQYLSAEATKTNFEQQFKIFPSQPVHIGDTWVQNTIVNSGTSVAYPVTFTLSSVNNGVAVIHSKGAINIENKDVVFQAAQVKLSLQGSQSGEIKIDMGTGAILSSNSKTSMKGNMQMMGMDIPLEVETSTTFTGRRIQL